MLRRSGLLLSGLALLVVVVGVASAQPYYVTDLAPVGADTIAVAYAVNSVSGVPTAVGFSQDLAGTSNQRKPVVWSGGGVPINLLPLIPGASAGTGNVTNGIDSNGDVAGATLIGGTVSAFYLPYSSGTATILPTLGGGGATSAAGVSNSGLVVGYSVSTDTYVDSNGNTVNAPHAFVWSASTGMVDLGLTNNCSYATGISADGNTIIGDIGASGVGQLGQAVKWTKTGSTWTMTPLVQKSQYNQTVPFGINSSTNVVGGCFDYPEGGFPNVFQIALEFKNDGSIVRIGGLYQQSSAYARGINDSGVIVGYDGTTPFVNYTGLPGANTDLTTLVSPVSGAGWALKYAYGIDNNGEIVGRGTITSTNTSHGYLLTPAIPGDANADAKVDINDLTRVLSHYNLSGMDWGTGDFNSDGQVDINDLTIVLSHYNQTFGSSGAGIASVPEPSAVLLATIGLLGLTVALWRKGMGLARAVTPVA
jgi:probable HAF family extracellular repeat protein